MCYKWKSQYRLMGKKLSLGRATPRQICTFLCKISLTFFVLHIASEALINFCGVSESFYQDFFDAINLDEEFNLPAIYSGLLLFVCSLLLSQIGVSCKMPERKNWILLSRVFLFLSFDEVFQVHELFVVSELRQYVHPSLASIWVIPYGILFLLFSVRFLPFFLRLRGQMSILPFVAGGIYVSGAIAIEALNSWLVRTGQISRSGFYYEAISGFEELFEMLGVIIFLYSILLELQSRSGRLSYIFSVSERQSSASD